MWILDLFVCVCTSLLQCVCFKVKQNFSSKNLRSLLAPSFCLLSFPPQIFPVPQTSINLDFLDTFSPHPHSHTFSVPPPTNCLWLTLVTVFFHSGTASSLEEIPEYCKPPGSQCEISSYTTATNQNRVQHSIWTTHLPVSFILWSVSCPCFSHLLFSLSVCWVHNNRLSLEIKLLALLPSRLCPQKLPPNHLFGLHFLHSTNDWKLLSLLFIFYWVSPSVFVPPQSPDWVYLPGCLPALVILCWKANPNPSNVLPFIYCCFCKESSNKQIHPPPPNIWCLSGALNSWPEWVCGKKGRMVIHLTCKN